MASYAWLREINTASVSSGTGLMFGAKALALLLYRVLGFAATEDPDVRGTGDSVSAPDGANKQTLYDAAGLFVSGDVGKSITLSGCSNSVNNGTFTITDYTDSTQIKYVNASGVAETSSFSWVIDITDASFLSTEKSGVNGEINLTGSDFSFKDATASSFVSGDAGKWILLKDPTNSKNRGLYKITSYTDATTVVIDFRSAGTEYPIQRVSPDDDIEWYVLADNYQVPDRGDAYCRLTTTHADGWALEIKRNSYSASYPGLICRVAVDGNFGGSKIIGSVYCGVNSSDATWIYASVADNYVNFVLHDNTGGKWGGFTVNEITPVEASEKTAVNRVALMGCRNSNYAYWGDNDTWGYQEGDDVTTGYVWNQEASTICHQIDWTYRNSSESLRRDSSRAVNKRTNKWDYQKSFIVIDWQNTTGLYERLGELEGLFTASGNITTNSAFNAAGTKDMFHPKYGNCIDWPGLTDQH